MTPHQALDAEVTRKLGEVGLEDKADAMAASLSGGQKRKLSGMIQHQRQCPIAL
jgi:ABC-type polar amino acid transport system ATPase subunit